MTPYTPHLAWIDLQADQMRNLLHAWCNLNTGTFNPLGLSELADLVQGEFAKIADETALVPAEKAEQIDNHGNRISLRLGPNVSAIRRPDAGVRVLLAIHMDTVYGPDSPFQSVNLIDENTLQGPGVADAKGGLIVMLFALKALERFVQLTGQKRLGWEVIVNSDEEIGSPGSTPLFANAAKSAQIGLLFEPSLPHGGLISSRKGSGNFSIVAQGQSAHAGRDFHLGRNAVVAAAAVTGELHKLNGRWPEMTLNVARIDGGGPSNMVPALAVARLNIRYTDRKHEPEIKNTIDEILTRVSSQTGVPLSLNGEFTTPPKQVTPALEAMFKQLQSCGQKLELELAWGPSGGSCDGNRLAALGVPNLDTMGVRGGKIHSPEEYVLLDSLTERAKLTALYLMRLADGGLSPPVVPGASASH
ncbi:MAG TPA: hydrolase [Planctomicrobium sp.]|nr:hydrolase [Planctomicrobium sp.]